MTEKQKNINMILIIAMIDFFIMFVALAFWFKDDKWAMWGFIVALVLNEFIQKEK